MTTTVNTDDGAKVAVAYLRAARGIHRTGGWLSSVQRQQRTCEDYARQHGLTIIDIYVDNGASGLSPRRPLLDRMLRELSRGRASYLITANESRLARNAELLLALELEIARYGVELRICDQHQTKKGGARANSGHNIN